MEKLSGESKVNSPHLLMSIENLLSLHNINLEGVKLDPADQKVFEEIILNN